MSFFQSDPASCGPTNAINSLNKHANTDRSLQQQLQFTGQQQQQQQALSQNQGLHSQSHFNTDAQLERDFQHFTNSATSDQFGNINNGSFVQFSQGQQQQHQGQFPEAQSLQGQGQGQQGWINDFQQMNISNQPIQHNHQAAHVHQSGWSSEYSTMAGTANPLVNQQQHQQSQLQQPNQFRQSSYNAPYFQRQQQQQQQQSQFTQSANMQYNQQHNSDVFETAFDDIESQLQDQQLAEEEQLNEEPEYDQKSEEDKIKFAEIAKNVFNTMSNTPSNISSETGNKFQNSKFLKLMNRISTREVEINDGGNKFIDSQGKDIRDMLPDPLKDIRENDFSQSYYSNNDERDFVGPFKAAQIVHDKFESGDRMKPTQWDSTLDI